MRIWRIEVRFQIPGLFDSRERPRDFLTFLYLNFARFALRAFGVFQYREICFLRTPYPQHQTDTHGLVLFHHIFRSVGVVYTDLLRILKLEMEGEDGVGRQIDCWKYW